MKWISRFFPMRNIWEFPMSFWKSSEISQRASAHDIRFQPQLNIQQRPGFFPKPKHLRTFKRNQTGFSKSGIFDSQRASICQCFGVSSPFSLFGAAPFCVCSWSQSHSFPDKQLWLLALPKEWQQGAISRRFACFSFQGCHKRMPWKPKEKEQVTRAGLLRTMERTGKSPLQSQFTFQMRHSSAQISSLLSLLSGLKEVFDLQVPGGVCERFYRNKGNRIISPQHNKNDFPDTLWKQMKLLCGGYICDQ